MTTTSIYAIALLCCCIGGVTGIIIGRILWRIEP